MVVDRNEHHTDRNIGPSANVLQTLDGVVGCHALSKIWLVLGFCIFLFSDVIASTNFPVKILVTAKSEDVWKGERIPVTLTLLDANNQPSIVDKDWLCQLDVLGAPDSIFSEIVTIKPGSSSSTINLELKKPGIYELRASHSELLVGGIFLNVKDETQTGDSSDTETGSDGTRDGSDEGIDLQDLLHASKAPPVPVVFRSTPVRSILADGTDSTTISALVAGENAIALHDIHIQLHNSGGELTPKKIVIPKGRFSGSAVLTSSHTGPVTVEYVSSIPAVDAVGDDTLTVDFRPPITAFTVNASPNVAEFAERVDLIASLVDVNGTALATDRPRKISFAVEKGRGKLALREIVIPAGNHEGRIELYPTHVGQVVISATSPELRSVKAGVDVTLPLAIIFISAIGGLIGGLFSKIFVNGKLMWQATIGLVTGLVLYWAVLYGGLELITRGYVLSPNPLSAFIIAFIGGWLGVIALTPILKQLES